MKGTTEDASDRERMKLGYFLDAGKGTHRTEEVTSVPGSHGRTSLPVPCGDQVQNSTISLQNYWAMMCMCAALSKVRIK